LPIYTVQRVLLNNYIGQYRTADLANLHSTTSIIE
jgi:hypothetical protein